jgi:hypothetical protein
MCSERGCWRCGLGAAFERMDRRGAELEAIDEFIAGRGVTSCRSVYVGAVRGALPLREERERVAALKVEQGGESWLDRNRSRRRWLARIRGGKG